MPEDQWNFRIQISIKLKETKIVLGDKEYISTSHLLLLFHEDKTLLLVCQAVIYFQKEKS